MTMADQTSDIFCFRIDNLQLAIPFSTVDRVLRAVEITQVPNSPSLIYGIFDYHGKVVAAINLRHRLKLPSQPVRIHDVFIIAKTRNREIALVADRAEGIIHPQARDLSDAADLDAGFEAGGILRRDDGIILIYDIEKFLSAQDDLELQQVIQTNDQETK